MTYATQDEALAALLAESQPGDRIDIHEDECGTGKGSDERCTCEPMVIVVGAAA